MKKIARAKLVILAKEIKIISAVKKGSGVWGTPNNGSYDCVGGPVAECPGISYRI